MRCFFILIGCLLTPYLAGADRSFPGSLPSLQQLAMASVIKQLNSLATEQIKSTCEDDLRTIIEHYDF